MGSFETAAQIIDALGGTSRVARRTKLTPAAVSEMKRENRIAPKHWRAIISLAGEKKAAGITLENLARLYEKERA